ncbi:MAG: DEAD/DEAH box helicase [Ilumatobacteraceae bacterium]|nr:DEAD/DEAH box helicase [Ilumatobacteraceae bacterium]
MARRGITEPTEIQTLSIPDGLAGKDVCGKAPTGSGKTIAFGLVLVSKLKRAKPAQPTGLVLVPTRELAQQVCDEIDLLDASRTLRATAVFGGAGYGPQLRRVGSASIIVATPGRLEDLISRRDIDLRAVQIAVLDEADRMADMGFLPAVRKILDRVPTTRQVLLYSATLDGAVSELISRYQRNPVRHDASSPETVPDIEHVFELIPKDKRLNRIDELLQIHTQLILFCRTKHGSDRVARNLESEGNRCAIIHGNRSQAQRERALDDFRRGKARILVATDVAARGIHIDAVPCVVHWDPPDDPKDYVHRSGRTGRAGARGVVVSLVDPSQRRSVVRDMRSIDIDVQWATGEVAKRQRPGEMGWLAPRSAVKVPVTKVTEE